MALKNKQTEAMTAFRSKQFKYMCHAGTTGSGKTFFDLALLHILCCNIPGVRFFVGRKTEKNLRQTTIPSYKEMKRKTKSEGESEIVNMTAKYKNGSEILFIWCDISKDPDLNNVRGLEVNGGLFEEANQISQKYFELAKTRIGRWRPELCPAFILLNLNPSAGWVKDVFYDNWVAGTLPPGYYFLEFNEEDAEQCSGVDYVKGLADLAKEEYDRFVKNRWNYSVAANQLIQFEWYKNCMRLVDPVTLVTDRVLGVTDPAWEGDDDTVFARMHNNHIGWWDAYEKQDPDFSGILAHQQVQTYNIHERDWIVDPVGVGSATVLKMRNDLKYEPDMFYGGAPATNMFGVLEIFNKRSEGHWLLREAMRQGEITFTHTPEFQEQCLAAKYFIDDKKIRIIEKKLIKKDIGISPGHLDCAMMLVHKWKTECGIVAGEIMGRQLNVAEQVSSRARRERMEAIRRSREID